MREAPILGPKTRSQGLILRRGPLSCSGLYGNAGGRRCRTGDGVLLTGLTGQSPELEPVQTMISVVIFLLTTIEVIAALLLIGIILIQQSKSGGGLTAMGGGMTESVFGAAAGNVLTKGTVTLAAVFLAATLALAIITGHRGPRRSVADGLAAEAPAAAEATAVSPSATASGAAVATPAAAVEQAGPPAAATPAAATPAASGTSAPAAGDAKAQ